MPNAVSHFYEFGPFRLDPEKHRLFHHGEPVQLSPKAVEALLVLVKNHGRLLERETLIEAVWADAFVEDANLTVAISTLRKVLGQNGESTEYIETIPRVGYRFIADVREISEQRPPMIIEKRTVSRTVIEEEELHPAPRQIGSGKAAFTTFRTAAIALAIILGGTIAYLIYASRSRPKPAALAAGRVKSLAVLPFKPLSGDASYDEYLGLGMSDSLITRLSNVKQFEVRPTSAILKFNNPNQDPAAAGRELGVQEVLEGRLLRDKDRVRVTVQLLRVSDGVTLWADTFDEQFTDICSVQDRISHHVAEALALKLTNEEEQQLAKKGTDSAEAFRAYLKGRHAWNKRSTAELNKAIKFFQQAIDLDPAYAAAFAGMADCYVSLGDYGSAPAKEVFPLAKAAAQKALEIDDSLAEAHTTLAHAKFLFDWDWAGAEREYQRAIELKPNYATAHHWYGWFLMAMGRSDEAMREIRRAEELDPLSLIIKANVGTFYYFSRQYDRAIELQRKVVEADPNFLQGRRKLAFSLEAKGAEQEAVAEWLKVEELFGTPGETIAAYRRATEAEGLKGYFRQGIAVELQDQSSLPTRAGAIASYYSRLNDLDQAFLWLGRAYDEREPWLVYAKISPVFDNLHNDARFEKFLKQMGL
jgi:DNA-binding winged helix-turn-helix (wHTH) protein/TolB-like protein